MDAGLVGAVIGGAVGLAGGAVGTYFSIRNTDGPTERAFMIKVSIIGWVAVLLFVGLMALLPGPYRHLLWIPYGVLLPLGIIKTNRQVAKIREAERRAN